MFVLEVIKSGNYYSRDLIVNNKQLAMDTDIIKAYYGSSVCITGDHSEYELFFKNLSEEQLRNKELILSIFNSDKNFSRYDHLYKTLSNNLKYDQDIIRAYEYRQKWINENSYAEEIYSCDSPVDFTNDRIENPEEYDEDGERGWWADNM